MPTRSLQDHGKVRRGREDRDPDQGEGELSADDPEPGRPGRHGRLEGTRRTAPGQSIALLLRFMVKDSRKRVFSLPAAREAFRLKPNSKWKEVNNSQV